MEEASLFLQAYGFDLSDPNDQKLIWNYFEEARNFIEKSLNDGTQNVPAHLRTKEALGDIRRLLLIASLRRENPDQKWACALLRVMHVLIHLVQDPRLRFFEEAQTQILGRLDTHLFVDEKDGATYLGGKNDAERVKLLFFKKKDKKDRDREIIKLLHKAGNLAEEIYDRLGFRLVTETKLDAICALNILISKNIIGVPNLRPGRSRNRLVDIRRLQTEIEKEMKGWAKKPPLSDAEVEKFFQRLERKIGLRRNPVIGYNPFTSDHFKAIQFTCRELVRIKNPEFELIEKVKNLLKDQSTKVEDLLKQPPSPFLYLFFPYEVQILDVKSYADSIFGKSSHEEYRRKQTEAARARVFGK